MNFRQELALQFRARVAVLNVVSFEERRVIRELQALKWPENHGLYTWDIGDQFVVLKESQPRFDAGRAASPDNVLDMVDQCPAPATFILKDFHQVWEAKRSNIRKLRNMAQRWPESQPARWIVITTPTPCLPDELKEEVPVVELGKPTIEEMDAILETSVDSLLGQSGTLRKLRPELRQRIVEAALGLSSTQAQRVFHKAVISGNRQAASPLDEKCIDLIVDEKRAIIRERGALEYYPASEGMDRVGGLGQLKKWLAERQDAFSEDARDFGVKMPRGLALIGIPGTGKSLCAKVTAASWKQPLLRLDMGAVFSGILGSSERNIREAIKISEVIAPCVLWVDEIEKAFAGSAGDSGTASRVLATFLTWMQEKKASVFVFATANNIEHLPPEFLRKGRFDEVFFLDLPTDEERQAILEVHLKRKNLSMIRQKFDLARVSHATEGFVGAELEAVVEDAFFPAYREGKREITTEDLLSRAGDMVPLAKSHAARVEALRKLVTGGLARNASVSDEREVVDFSRIRGTRLMDV